MFTVITEGNKVRQYHGVEYLHEVRKTENDYVIVNDTGEVEVYAGNPINWPTDAKNGLQAIVDVKEGTLRFAYDGWPRAVTEFVVSEYVAPVEPLKPESVQHIFDLIKYWPCGQPTDHWFKPAPLPVGFTWIPQPIHWLLGVVGSPKTYNRDDWEAHWSPDKPAQPGTKHDHGKPILGAVPPHAELAVGRVLTFGAEKYARGNWDKVEDHENRYMDAALRHLNAHRRGELTDSESGESHLAHAACCILFMLDKQERS